MNSVRVLAVVALTSLVASCGSSHRSLHGAGSRSVDLGTITSDSPAGTSTSPTVPAAAVSRPQALVTDEAQNRVLLVSLPSGRLLRWVSLPPDPEDIAATGNGGDVVVVSTAAGKVVVLGRSGLHRLKTFSGFDRPHIVAISPDGQFAYVTDDSRGALTVIRLGTLKVTRTIFVGAGAHHIAFSPNEHQVWVGLGESGRMITVLSTVQKPADARSSVVINAGRPHVLGHFAPGFPLHDLGFSPDGRTVWVTSAAGPDVSVFAAHSHRLLFRVHVGPSPQHLAFAGAYVYVTSGYGSRIERVNAATGRVVKRAGAPYGSFELSAADGYVATVSLLRGTIAIYTPGLKLLRVVHLAPATREVAISRP